MRALRIGLAQINCHVGALPQNVQKIKKFMRQAAERDVDLLAFPELAVCGYPPEDLLYSSAFVSDAREALNEVAEAQADFPDLTVLVGCLDRGEGRLYNGAAVLNSGRVLDIYHKHLLPNYGVFDEKRYFSPGEKCLVVLVRGVWVGVSICEDIWHREGPPGLEVATGGAEVVVNLNASPYHVGKAAERLDLLSRWASDFRCPVAYVNLVGGQDELVFDGRSLILTESGEVAASAAYCAEDLLIADIDADQVQELRRAKGPAAPSKEGAPLEDRLKTRIEKLVVSEDVSRRRPEPLPGISPPPGRSEEALPVIVLGVRDYVRKNGFSQVVLGLSGGIDSALTAAVAVEALGPEKVVSVFLPSRFTSAASLEDAAKLCENLGMRMLTIPIEPVFRSYLALLEEALEGTDHDVTEQNLQARIRGDILMALSNRHGWLLLSTGNKSEMSVGYTTLYGDMSGGFAVLKDVSKTLVYELSRHINERGGQEVIPARVLSRAPSAELGPDQKDSDSLPDYSVLDPIVRAYVEEELSAAEIISSGYDREIVLRVIEMIDGSEYKRRQAPPGVKITRRAFGKDRRLPITNGYHPKH